jgi:hypothetical protein
MNLAILLCSLVLQTATKGLGWRDIVFAGLKAVVPLVAGWLLKNALDAYDERRSLYRSSRLSSIQGNWIGEGQAEITPENPASLAFALPLRFDVRGKKITGKGLLKPKDQSSGLIEYTMEFAGGFYTDEYLYLTYRNSNQLYRHLGVIVLHQLPSGNLSGNYAGLSIARNRFVTGSVEFKKVITPGNKNPAA